MSVCFTLVSLSALVSLPSVQPSGTVRSRSSYALAREPMFRTATSPSGEGGLGVGVVEQRLEAAPRISNPGTISPHALFIVVHGFVIDSFFYPVAAIFHMAYFAAPLRARRLDEWLLVVIILAHIPLPRAHRSPPSGVLTAFVQRLVGFDRAEAGRDERPLFALCALSLCQPTPTPTHSQVSHTHTHIHISV